MLLWKIQNVDFRYELNTDNSNVCWLLDYLKI